MNACQMTEGAKEQRRAYYRKWRKENRNKVKEYNRRYWEHKADSALKKHTAKEANRHE